MWYIGTRGENFKLKVYQVCKVKSKSVGTRMTRIRQILTDFFYSKEQERAVESL